MGSKMANFTQPLYYASLDFDPLPLVYARKLDQCLKCLLVTFSAQILRGERIVVQAVESLVTVFFCYGSQFESCPQ